MKFEERYLELPPLTREAAVQPGSLDLALRTVDVTWTTGAAVLRGFFDRYWEELSLDPAHVRMGRLNNGAPLLNAHDGSDASGVIGVVEAASLQKKQGRATVRFAKDDPQAESIWRKVQDGILRSISVGYRVYKMEKVRDGEDQIPVFRATDWEPYELSVVPMGADAGAGFRAESQAQANQCVLVTREERNMDENENETTTKKTAEKESPAVAATRAASASRIEDQKLRLEEQQRAAEAATELERKRASAIRRIGRQCRAGEEWSTRLIEEGTSEEEARKLAFQLLADDPGNRGGEVETYTRIEAGEAERTKFLRGATAWLLQRTGTRELVQAAQKKNPERFSGVSFDPGEFRGASLCDLARLCLERARVNTRGMDRERLVQMALEMRGANYQTVGDFPVLLENILNKVLLGAYETQDNTWQRFCMAIDVNDFRGGKRYRTGSIGSLEVVPEHGEYQNKTIPDGAQYPVATQTYGGIIGLSRQAIVNDDMGALTQLAVEFGKAAMLSIEEAVFALLALNSGLGPTQDDSQPFFHANRANVNATGSAISETALDADRVVMSRQLDPAAQRYLNLRPAVLLVPDSLLSLARQIIFSPYSTASGATFQQLNIASGLYEDVVGSPYLSGTRRYSFATARDAIVVAFLNGQNRAPVVESQMGWRIAGIEWKVTLDAKAQMGDPKAAVTNAGT